MRNILLVLVVLGVLLSSCCPSRNVEPKTVVQTSDSATSEGSSSEVDEYIPEDDIDNVAPYGYNSVGLPSMNPMNAFNPIASSPTGGMAAGSSW